MQRCLQLAKSGAGHVAPNPMVGAVLVYKDTIIGEGFHEIYGQAHAEVNCINSVTEANKKFIEKSTLYVSLEPCAHHGKTPPCADLIIKNKIPGVVVACRDSYKEVDGKGIQKLQQAGVNVTIGILEKEAQELNHRFFTFHTRQRPYIILKWAQSDDGKIAGQNFSTIKISNEFTNRLVHKWRSEEASILVGTNTALYDNPSLTNRLWYGKNPVRVVIDRHLRLPQNSHLFNSEAKTIVFNEVKNDEQNNIVFHQLSADKNLLPELLNVLHRLSVQSVFVEGGAKLLQSFIDQGLWDEARMITNEKLIIGNGINAPYLTNNKLTGVKKIATDTISFYHKFK